MGLQEDKAKPKEKLSLIFLLVCTVSLIISADGYILKNCYISRDTAICAKNKLKAIPQDLPKTLTGYDLSLNLIMRIQQSDFQNLPVLIWLDLKHNNISQIDRAAFSSLISLQRLNLNYNKLDILGENVFDGLSSLTELRLTSNHLKIVASTSFKSLTSLTFLDLSYNKLEKMRNIRLILQHLPKLRTLVLTKNNLKTFRSWELTNHSLELNAIDICQNYLTELNISDNVFPNLTSFNIGGFTSKKPMIWDVRNKTFLSQVSRLDISGLPMALDSMKALFGAVNSSLTILRMNGMRLNLNALINISCSVPTMSMLQFKQNNLKHVHSDFFKSCIYVTELDLTKNNIQKIDEDAFRSLLSLKTLILSQNALVLVPSATRNLRFLTKLDLTSNKISTLNCDDFTNQTKLIELNLKNNSITALKDCIFKDLVRLQILRLQTNQITRLNNAFKLYLPNLRRLHLNNNKLPKIVSEEFKGLRSLQNLSLNDNQIEKLYSNSFVGLTNLTELLLVSNSITIRGLEAFNVLINLRRLDLSHNKIHYPTENIIRAPFSKLFNLKELSIPGQHHRDKSHLPVNFLQGLTNLLLFSARNSQLLSLPKDIFIYTPNLEKLDISSNDLRTLSSEMFSPLANLRSLYISTTLLKSLSFFVNANLTKLEFLQARKNHYSVITEKVIKSLPSLRYLDFMGNSFACDCYNAFFLNWLETNNTTQVFDAYNFECNYPDGLKDKKFLDLDFKSCSVDINFILFVTTSCLILSFMVATFTYHFMRSQLVYAYYILLAWLLDTKQKNKQTPNQYDAFISYNTHDEPWVIGELLPKLEEEQGWKLCLHHRDFEPGKPIIENITDAIYGSRKTICVISHRYLESEWCSREIQTASFRLFDEQKDVLILVFLEEIPTYLLSPYHRMRKLLKKKTYLSWTQAGEKPAVFWEKLRQALKTGEDMNVGSLLLSVPNTVI